MSFIRLTKKKKVDEILVQISRLIATLTPTYDYTLEGEDTSEFNNIKNIFIGVVNDEVKKNIDNLPELKKRLLFFLNEDFKVTIEEALAEGKKRYDAKNEENIEEVIEKIRRKYTRQLEKAENEYRMEVSREAQRAQKRLTREEMENWNPKEFNEMDYEKIRKLYEKFDEAIKLYEQLKGKKYRKGIKINKEKEEAEKSIRQDKEEARKARDELLAKQREERKKREELLARQKAEREARKPKKSQRQEEQEKYGLHGPIPENIVLDDIDKTLTSYSIPAKVKKGIFSDIKDLVSSIVEEETKSEEYYDKNGNLLSRDDLKKICENLARTPEPPPTPPAPPPLPPINILPSAQYKRKPATSRMSELDKTLKGLQPQYPEQEGNRDRTGRLLTDEELDRLRRARSRLAEYKLPKKEEEKGEELEHEEPEPPPAPPAPPTPKRRGRPANPDSKRQKKLKEPEKEKENKPEPKKRGPKPNPESKRQKELAKKQEPAPPTDEPKKRGRPKKAPEEKSRPPPKKEGVGRPKKCDKVKPKVDDKQPYGLREDKKTITKIDVFSLPFETKKGTRYEVNQYLLMNINATPPRFLNVVDKILEKSNLKIDNERTKEYRKSFLEELEGLRSSGRKRAMTYRKITQYLIAKGITTAYELEHELTQEILNDLNEKEDSAKLVAFEKYVEKNCIDKSKSEVPAKPKEKKTKEKKQPKEEQKDPDMTFNYMLENIDKYSNEFKKAEQPTAKTILKIVKDIWSKPANNTIRIKDGNTETYITDLDENGNVLGDTWNERPLKAVIGLIIRAISEKYDVPELDTYLKIKENKKELTENIVDLLTEILDPVGGRLLKKNEPVPRRYK